jgi:hypothetical protein
LNPPVRPFSFMKKVCNFPTLPTIKIPITF